MLVGVKCRGSCRSFGSFAAGRGQTSPILLISTKVSAQ